MPRTGHSPSVETRQKIAASLTGRKHTAERRQNISAAKRTKGLPTIAVDGGVARIPLGGKRGAGKFALVDVADLPLVERLAWSLSTIGYANGSAGHQSELMHNLILRTDNGSLVDHVNGDRLDNRRQNLRPVTRSQHAQNMLRSHGYLGRPQTSQYRGVSWDARRQKWVASVKVGGVMVFQRRFADEESAAVAAAGARDRYMTHNNESRHPAPSAGNLVISEASAQ